MAYIVNKFDGTLIATVEDGTIDNTTNLRFIGKNYAGYGEIQNENFLHLLENFASGSQPSRPLGGQIWFDSSSSKLKFYDGTKFRTTGGAEVGTTAPVGLTTGDFWWDSANSQLYAWDGTSFILVGPQGTGSTVTQFVSRQIKDNLDANQIIIEGKINNITTMIFSSVAFTIGTTDPTNTITGFDVVKKGITLVNTQSTTNGVTSTDARYWGTASNSDRLGGFEASDYIRSGASAFSSIVRFGDVGFTVGDSNDLKVSIENGTEGSIANEIGNKISLKVNDSGSVNEIAFVNTDGIIPGTGNKNLGIVTDKWYEVHANYFKGLADSASGIEFGAQTYLGSTNAVNNTVALRDGSGEITASVFNGRATQASYADLAEIYTTDQTYDVGTVMAIGGDAETTAFFDGGPFGGNVFGVISGNPGFLMNKDAEGQAIAFVGRVPVKVEGPVEKGQKVYAKDLGMATATKKGQLVGFALETNADESMKLVEVALRLINN
jgi:hypothetical protein